MIRSSFFSVGTFVLLCGVTFLYADKVVLKDNGEKLERDKNIRGMMTNQQIGEDVRRVIDPPEWAAFSLLSVGAVTMLYSIALPHHRHYHD